MKIVIISDSHGNIVNLKHVLGFAEKIKADGIIHCGDWNTLNSAEIIVDSRLPLYSVLGNADIDPEIEKYLKIKSKKFTRTYLELVLNKKKIGVIHDISELIQSPDILFYGHTHRQVERFLGGVRTINPGPLESEINFAVYDSQQSKVEFIHE